MRQLPSRTNILLLVLLCLGWNALSLSPGIAQTDSLQLVPETAPLPLNGDLVPLDSAEPVSAPESNQNSTQNSDSAIAPAFTFTNTLEYGDCLEVILRFYENVGGLREREQQNRCYAEIQQRFGTDGISKAEALRLVSAANFYATTILGTDLYPARGQRIRVATLFGFIYAIDTNDTRIRELAAQAQQ